MINAASRNEEYILIKSELLYVTTFFYIFLQLTGSFRHGYYSGHKLIFP